jgi:hypothetical protein
VSAKTTNTVNNRKPLMGMKKEAMHTVVNATAKNS